MLSWPPYLRYKFAILRVLSVVVQTDKFASTKTRWHTDLLRDLTKDAIGDCRDTTKGPTGTLDDDWVKCTERCEPRHTYFGDHQIRLAIV